MNTGNLFWSIECLKYKIIPYNSDGLGSNPVRQSYKRMVQETYTSVYTRVLLTFEFDLCW